MTLRRTFRWTRNHRKTAAGLVLVLLFVAANAFAFVHAYAMTHFAGAGQRTENPEHLSHWQKVKVLLTGVRLPKPTNLHTPADLNLPFETRHFSTSDGIDLEAWLIPAPPPAGRGTVVLFHGYSACKSALLPEAKAFHDLGYATLLIDFRGSGGSAGNVTTIGYLEADDVSAAASYARTSASSQSSPLILYGQSMGSAAILRAIAGHGLRPDAIIIECPFDRLLTTVENRFHAMGLPSFPMARLLVFWGGLQHGYNAFRHNPAEYAKAVTCPALLLHGSADTRVTRPEADAVFQNLAGPKSRVTFEGISHEDYLLKNPRTWTTAVSSFLTALHSTRPVVDRQVSTQLRATQ